MLSFSYSILLFAAMQRPSKINVLAELERYGFVYTWASDREVRFKCPFHPDDTPSCTLNVEKQVFKCHSAQCGMGGDFITLLAGQAKVSRQVVIEELNQRYDLSEYKIVDPEVVERWHQNIWKEYGLVKALHDRGVTDELISKYRLGATSGRITIPIFNKNGDVVNVRKYLPGAPSPDKMRNLRGRGSARWYPIDQLNYEEIMLCGGEMKAIVAAEQLNKHNIGAACVTQGETKINVKLLNELRDKIVYVCFDIDEAGVKGAEENARLLLSIAREVYIVRLPLTIDEYPKGDINDFVASGGDLFKLIESDLYCHRYTVVEKLEAAEGEAEKVILTEVSKPTLTGKRITTKGVIVALDTTSYIVPKLIEVDCDRKQKECSICRVFASQEVLFKVLPESPAILEMVGCHKLRLNATIKEVLGVPATCKSCKFNVKEYYSAEDVRLTQQLEITTQNVEQRLQPAVCLDSKLELNETYELEGAMYPHPVTQQSYLLISKSKPTLDALSTYECNDLERLTVFRPNSWTIEGIENKLNHIYSEFEKGITHIYQRRDMHLLVDLAYHSPLLLNLGDRVVKGWVEVLIVGDSANGKTEVTSRMMRYYKLGERLDCKNATVAGLLGGLQQLGQGKWFVTWGVIPRHDRRLVILEELKGAPVEIIAKLTDMRSSGIAELSKIEKRRTHARTRIIAVSNPRSDRAVNTYSYGVDIIKELIGNLEDIRRFDAFLITANEDVDKDVLAAAFAQQSDYQPEYDSELCRELILWTWTRQLEDVIIPTETVEITNELAENLCNKYTDALPLLDKGTARYKLLRLAAALSARLFSTGDSLTQLLVRPETVTYIANMLDKIYSKPTFGYREFTESILQTTTLIDESVVVATIKALPFPKNFVESLLRRDYIELQDLQDLCSWDREKANELLSLLVRKHALTRVNRSYRKTAPFIELLRKLRLIIEDRPAFIESEPALEF